MKRTLAALVLLGTTAMSAHADVTWQGDVFVKTATAQCAPFGISDSSFFRGVFKPSGIGDNGTTTKLSLLGTRNVIHYQIANQGFTAGTYDGLAVNSTADIITFTSVFTMTSAAPLPTATKQTIVLKAKIATFTNITGCTVTIIGSMGLRP